MMKYTADNTKDRITELRIKKGVSEYQMSYDLGHSKSYVHSISSGRAVPSFREFFVICEYLGVTPKDFFDDELANPLLVEQIIEGIRGLNDEDLQTVLGIVDRLKSK